MHPLLLHQLADDSVTDRHRHARSQGRVVRRTRTRPTSRFRVWVGGLLVTVGTRLAGTRPAPAVLHHPTSASS